MSPARRTSARRPARASPRARAPGGAPTLTRRALNRATLARQLLLKRARLTPVEAVEALAGLQAQAPRPPFIGLWTRLEKLAAADVLEAFEKRQLVRATAMRGTIHWLSAKDYRQLRASLQPALTWGMNAILRERAKALDLPALEKAARALFSERPRTFDEAREELVRRFPKGDERAMGFAVRNVVPLVQVPQGAPWGFPAAADFALAGEWLKGAHSKDDSPLPLARKYLAAFGPATPQDFQTWSALPLPSARDAFEKLRGELRAFRDERGRELFDLPDAPRPDEDVPAPTRFLPEFDNLVLSHADRTRVIADEHRGKVVTKNLQVRATFLLGGEVAGTWKVERKKKAAALVLEPFGELAKRDLAALEEEGERLLRFCEPDAEDYAVRGA
ncbi:MAG TPA: winged helix DNA-binding domain-containing protein [Myxococcaceae bacterium]|nr:winged helix DNA-binding domain-containing protein [Myxococcaceae bacterium]